VAEVRSLWKYFNSVPAIKGISFEIEKGEILGVLGANGAGKSTLIYCMLGVCSFEKGEIIFFNNLKMPKDRKKILERINFASTYTSLPYSLTVYESLLVFGNLYRVKRIKEKIEMVLDMFSIKDLKNTPLRKLSSGQLMRVNLAKSMLNDPEILLLDEPTAGLDPEIAEKTRNMLKKRCKEIGLSILYTSHNLNEIEDIADKILILKKGEIVAYDKKDQLIRKYGVLNLKELYFKVASDES